MELLISFASVNDAIAAEAALADAGLPVRVMSLPSAIRAGCGICLRVDSPRLAAARATLAARGIAPGGLYTRTPAGAGSTYLPYKPAGAPIKNKGGGTDG
jgi:hypothetical protein